MDKNIPTCFCHDRTEFILHELHIWHNLELKLTLTKPNCLLTTKHFNSILQRSDYTNFPSPNWTSLHFLCTCASARHCQHSSQMIQTSFIIWSAQLNYPHKLNTLCTDMIKDFVMVAMEAAKASSPMLEKEIVMKLCIIIPHCVAQVSNGGGAEINNNNTKKPPTHTTANSFYWKQSDDLLQMINVHKELPYGYKGSLLSLIRWIIWTVPKLSWADLSCSHHDERRQTNSLWMHILHHYQEWDCGGQKLHLQGASAHPQGQGGESGYPDGVNTTSFMWKWTQLRWFCWSDKILPLSLPLDVFWTNPTECRFLAETSTAQPITVTTELLWCTYTI